jgi:hypothetical protein
MSPLLLLLLLPGALIVSGYPLAIHLRALAAAERVAVAALAGLVVWLLLFSAVNFFAPLSGWRAWLCLAPGLLTLSRRASVTSLGSDLAATFFTRKGALAAALGAGSLLALTWPEFRNPSLIFYDGTSSHDGYLWIAGAEHLQTHAYMEPSVDDFAHPWATFTTVLSGWAPHWGRAASENLLAFVGSISRRDPVEIYLAATAALLIPWTAAVYLAVRTFWMPALSPAGVVALFALQPLFVFYRANGNLPNLLGALSGGTLVVAFARSLERRPHRKPWIIVVALAVHGCLFSYPEIFPFVALPCALLFARALIRRNDRSRLDLRWALFAFAGGLVLNPATLLRAIQGFTYTFELARQNADWVNIFGSLAPSQYLPSLLTLSLPSAKFLGNTLSLLGSLLSIVAAGFAFRRAHDRFGALASLSGGALLLVYTVATGFHYGWQKTALFSGVFLAALMPVAAIDPGGRACPNTRAWRASATILASGIAALFALALAFHQLELEKWSRRKALTSDWLVLRDFARESLNERTVVVDGATFPMTFFHSMWAAYFMPDAKLIYAARGEANGGYLHHVVLRESSSAETRAAVLVGAEWARTFDANSPSLLTGKDFALMRVANRVPALHGFFPDTGVPERAGSRLALEVRPHKRSSLHLTLAPSDLLDASPSSWQITLHTEGSLVFETTMSGPPPWNFVVPLAPAQSHHIELIATPEPSQDSFPYRVTTLRIADAP